jgi:hypothetical protein
MIQRTVTTENEEIDAYIEAEGLNQLINFNENAQFQEGAFDLVSNELATQVPPEKEDLVRLHKFVRRRKSFTALEFGTGYSTIVIADALAKNERDWQALPHKPELRNRHLFQLFTVDASEKWLENSAAKLPASLRSRVHFKYSPVEIGTFQGQLCHYYKQLPDIVPDFIYLDGPAPKDVQGSINGLTFQCDERTVMSGDLLLMESIFLPGTFIVADGRTNNVRFLQRNFKRSYKIVWDREADITTFELLEPRLGKYNVLGYDYF